jgi:glycyl-tRNA synthetase, dimeric type
MQSSVATTRVSLDKLVSLCKRRGFVYPSAEIYGGINGIYDMGPLGTLLKQNIRDAWKKSLANTNFDIVFLEGALIGPHAMWEASGHIENFHDPMVDCLVCKHRFRADDIDMAKACSHCGNKQWTEVRQFNLMFTTQLGAASHQSTTAYLRPETAQAIFINFKNVLTSSRVKIPFGIAQMGKSFRNEITPKQFLFRMREFEQMEIEWFCKEETALAFFEQWLQFRREFYRTIGIQDARIRVRPHDKDELSHYSSATSDMEYEFPFGWKELEGVAYRGNFDLTQHMKFSGKDLSVYDDATKQAYVPHVVECSVGIERLFLMALCDAYCEEEIEGETRIVLKLSPKLAPIKAAFLPLTKEQVVPMEKIYQQCKALGYELDFDVSGSIGKRYRRNDEIGTPVCFTYDFESSVDGAVTARNRDTMQQERIAIDKLEEYLRRVVIGK